ncbi:ABC transporter ATP-binding protein/permease [Candidatus Bandiella numerosa]|uniref:ABC transporter ATP-binding protein n=1 Tax=Candidatus Bandiella numerosa TaxID=2570586 RepID=UPI00249DE9AD|nr:ABC transporter ATP-binding protein [Candidatus Bandiella numerosa]WHA04416.1 ABC transporter ATP-binding protein/permease [Candidatus Bandiella numerosa]
MVNKSKIIKEIFNSLFDCAPKIRKKIFFSIFLFFLIALLNLSMPWVFRYIVEILADNKFQPYIIIILIGYGLIWLLSNILFKIREFVSCEPFEKAISNFDLKVFRSLIHLPLDVYHEHHTGGVMNAIEMSQRSIAYILYGMFFSIIPVAFELLVTIIIIGCSYGFSYTFLLMTFPWLYIAYSWSTMKYILKKQKDSSTSARKFASYVNDMLSNIDGIHYQFAQSLAVAKFKKISFFREYSATQKFELSALLGIGQNLIAGICLLVMMLVIGINVQKGVMDIGDFVLFTTFLIQLITPLNLLCNMGREVLDGLTKMENIMDIVEPNLQILNEIDGNIEEIDDFDLSFKNVSFNFNDQSKKVLNNVNFRILFNKTTAIVGENGAGKSTIAKLIFRILEPSKGSVFIGNYNIKDLKYTFLRDIIVIVPQNIFILDDSVSENLLFGNDFKTSDSEFIKIMSSIGVEGFVNLLPKGYETKLGENGVKISGGQKQLIGIARVLLKKPKIIIFDEATSALDKNIEKKVFAYLNSLSNITKIIITHDYNNLEMMDEILYLSNGNLIRQGKHFDLLSSCKGYRKLFERGS